MASGKAARFALTGAILLAVLFLSLVLSLRFGVTDFTVRELLSLLAGEGSGMRREILVNLRLPRFFAGALTGGSLAVCGAVMQAAVRNPMADPYLMGVSSGATLGATLCILTFGGRVGLLGLSGSAFAGAMACSLLISLISFGTRANALLMILIGLAINALCSSLGSLLVYLSFDANLLRNLVFWLMGSLAPATWDQLPFLFWINVPGLVFFCSRSRNLNLIMLGDDEAGSLGLSPGNFRLLSLGVVALMTASCVSCFGMIGFVGIIIPHVLRFFFGSNHIYLLPLSFLAGASFLVSVDLLARSAHPSEIPLGVITGIIGSPFFVWILLRRWRTGR
ncbi:MAG: iron ABC transporter permease [Deltaproteobacteria bacterium]|jgi:iron complex transport system permease protein|nr:iron ABC transporter permease [Deltaproteobacteria bacterium]